MKTSLVAVVVGLAVACVSACSGSSTSTTEEPSPGSGGSAAGSGGGAGGSGGGGTGGTGGSSAGGDGGDGGSGPVDSGGPVLQKLPGTFGCGSNPRWIHFNVTNVGESGTALVTVTVSEGTTSYVENQQFAVVAEGSYYMSVGVPVTKKSVSSYPAADHVLNVVVSLPGSSDVTVQSWSVEQTGVPPNATWSWLEPTGPSTTTIGPYSEDLSAACPDPPGS